MLEPEITAFTTLSGDTFSKEPQKSRHTCELEATVVSIGCWVAETSTKSPAAERMFPLLRLTANAHQNQSLFLVAFEERLNCAGRSVTFRNVGRR